MNANETTTMLKVLLEQEERIERLEKMLESLEPITEEDIENLRNVAEARVAEVLGGKSSLPYIGMGDKMSSVCMRDVRMSLCVPRYSELKKSDYAKALELIERWEPNEDTRVVIKHRVRIV